MPRVWQKLLCSATLAGLVLVAATPPAGAADERPIWARADTIEATVGAVELRRGSTERLELPLLECEDGERWSCSVDAIYGQVWLLDFHQQTLSAGQPASVEPRGRLIVAADLPPAAADAFERNLVEHLEGLGAPSFVEPRAGMRWIRGPLEQRAFDETRRPAWICTGLDGRFAYDWAEARDGRVVTTASGGHDRAEAPCRAIADTVEDAPPRTFRSMPAVAEQVRHTVWLDTADTLGGLTRADRLAPLPEGIAYEKTALEPGRMSGGMWHSKGEVIEAKEGRYHDVERLALMPPASLELLETPMWVARYRFETLREHFGADPATEEPRRSSILLAVLPVEDPLMAPLERERAHLDVPRREITRRVLDALEREAEPGPDVVVQALALPELWSAAGDWLAVACHDDGSASYAIAPFPLRARVTNPQEACGAIARELD